MLSQRRRYFVTQRQWLLAVQYGSFQCSRGFKLAVLCTSSIKGYNLSGMLIATSKNPATAKDVRAAKWEVLLGLIPIYWIRLQGKERPSPR